MKPDWKDAPEWATHLAMESDGAWFWFEGEPYAAFDGSWCGTKATVGCPNRDWKESLEARPEQ